MGLAAAGQSDDALPAGSCLSKKVRAFVGREPAESSYLLCDVGGAPTAGLMELDSFRWQARCRDLYQLPAAA